MQTGKMKPDEVLKELKKDLKEYKRFYKKWMRVELKRKDYNAGAFYKAKMDRVEQTLDKIKELEDE